MSVMCIGSVLLKGLPRDNVHKGCYGQKQSDRAYNVFSERDK